MASELPEVHFGEVASPTDKLPPLLDQADDDDDAPATEDVVAILGFDPAEQDDSPLHSWPIRPLDKSTADGS